MLSTGQQGCCDEDDLSRTNEAEGRPNHTTAHEEDVEHWFEGSLNVAVLMVSAIVMENTMHKCFLKTIEMLEDGWTAERGAWYSSSDTLMTRPEASFRMAFL
jgi:hypothetical protein